MEGYSGSSAPVTPITPLPPLTLSLPGAGGGGGSGTSHLESNASDTNSNDSLTPAVSFTPSFILFLSDMRQKLKKKGQRVRTFSLGICSHI